jgi:hypothetical protein
MNFIKGISISVWFVFFLILFWGIVPSYVHAQDECNDCHKDVTFVVKQKKLYDYYRYWKNSVHDIAKISCDDCHGGNPDEKDKEDAHKGDFTSFKDDGKKSFTMILQRCSRCHKAVYENFIESKHYKSLDKQKDGPHCVTCHGSMNTGIFEASNVAKGCEACHNEETKNKPEIGNVAERVLHNLNILRVYRKWLWSNNMMMAPSKKYDMINQYKDIVLSWHQFNFEQIEEKLKVPLENARMITRETLADSKRNTRQRNN